MAGILTAPPWGVELITVTRGSNKLDRLSWWKRCGAAPCSPHIAGTFVLPEEPPTSAVMHIIGELQEHCQAIKGSQQATALQGYSVPCAAAAAAICAYQSAQVPMSKTQLSRKTSAEKKMENNIWVQTSATRSWTSNQASNIDTYMCLLQKTPPLLCLVNGSMQRSTFHFEPRSQIINLLCQKGRFKSSGFISHLHLVRQKGSLTHVGKREN